MQMDRRFLLGGALATAGLGVSGAALAQTGAARFARLGAGAGVFDHAAWDRLLEAYVRPGADGINRIRYGAWRDASADRAALAAYIAALAGARISALSRPEQFAFWVNLYNALTVRTILDAFPVRSIRDIRPTLLSIGPWGQPAARIDGVDLSLDDIEHRILRPGFGDNRVHYAVNCASLGCPNLAARAWRGATLEADLDIAARAFINHPRGARIEAGRLRVSSIFHWYEADFGGTDAGVIAHLARFAAPPLRAGLAPVRTISGHDYDWRLNGA